MKLEIDQHRLLAELETLSSFSDAVPPAVTRIVFTPSDLRARTWLISRCEEAGLHGNLQDVKLPTGYYKAFLELHIEQGPLLERSQTPLGIVMSIAAPASLHISVEGAGGHAGGVLMPDRKDALCAAAELVLAIENAARTSRAGDTVA